ncbi:hypothetical protein E2C01_021552 [Portunus trituberculatus]|uniref:Uncharacterized protein n=1 Tax=Portunus trituberculatus TaxID=210409 RepID=A0A5B7E309_PORTR|nr:hypothetical protein [Portunus trituberculatus]
MLTHQSITVTVNGCPVLFTSVDSTWPQATSQGALCFDLDVVRLQSMTNSYEPADPSRQSSSSSSNSKRPRHDKESLRSALVASTRKGRLTRTMVVINTLHRLLLLQGRLVAPT